MHVHVDTVMPEAPALLLPEGWAAATSRSRGGVPYFTHAGSQRIRWTPPDVTQEAQRADALAYYDARAAAEEADDDEDDGDGGGASPSPCRAFVQVLGSAAFFEVVHELGSSEHCGRFAVLDAGCGDARDAARWGAQGCEDYRGFDASLRRAAAAAAAVRACAPDAVLPARCVVVAGDMCAPAAWRDAGEGRWDIVSFQHSLQYAFGTAEDAEIALRGAAGALRAHGRVVAVLPDAEYWLQRAAAGSGGGAAGAVTVGGVGFSLCIAAGGAGPFGRRYIMNRPDGVALAEYCVTAAGLAHAAQGAGLEVVLDVNLATFATWLGVQSPLLEPHRAFPWRCVHRPALRAACGSEYVSGDAWARASAFRLVVLRKQGAPTLQHLFEGFHGWALSVGRVAMPSPPP